MMPTTIAVAAGRPEGAVERGTRPGAVVDNGAVNHRGDAMRA